MTISSTVRVAGPYSGNDATVTFSFAFKVFAAADVQVILTDSTDTESVLTLTTDYTVTLNGNQDTNPGGSVTLLVAPATGEKLTVTSDQASYQSVNLANQGGFYPEVINNQLDKLAINIQQCERDIAQAARVPLSSSIDPDIVSDALITVATSIGDVETVAGSIGDVGTVATNIANVNLVGGDITNVNSVAGDLINIDSVAGDLTNVDTVAADIADVSTCADNIVLIQSAPANAASASASASLALAANEAAEAAASVSGDVLFYDTKADADAALSGLSEGQIVEVVADEDVSGLRTRYRVETSAYVFKIIIGEAKISTVAALRAIPYSAMLTTAHTLGCVTAGDGGDGLWRWDASSSASDNVGTVVLPTGHVGNGRWLRVYDGVTHYLEWFGGIGDGLTDCTTAMGYLGTLLRALGSGTVMLKPNSTYNHTNPLWCYGIRSLKLIGDNSTLCNTLTSAPAGAVLFYPFILNFPQEDGLGLTGWGTGELGRKIATVSTGARSITLLTPADASAFTVGEICKITSRCFQRNSFPYNYAYVDFVTISSIDAVTGVIRFNERLQYTHRSDDIEYVDGAGGTQSVLGAARIWPNTPAKAAYIAESFYAEGINFISSYIPYTTLTSTGTAPADGVIVTIGEIAYTFKTTLSSGPTVPYEVLIGGSAAIALDNLKLAINAGAGIGTNYSTGTEAHPNVTATTNTNTTQVIERKDTASFTVADWISHLFLDETSATLSWDSWRPSKATITHGALTAELKNCRMNTLFTSIHKNLRLIDCEVGYVYEPDKQVDSVDIQGGRYNILTQGTGLSRLRVVQADINWVQDIQAKRAEFKQCLITDSAATYGATRALLKFGGRNIPMSVEAKHNRFRSVRSFSDVDLAVGAVMPGIYQYSTAAANVTISGNTVKFLKAVFTSYDLNTQAGHLIKFVDETTDTSTIARVQSVYEDATHFIYDVQFYGTVPAGYTKLFHPITESCVSQQNTYENCYPVYAEPLAIVSELEDQSGRDWRSVTYYTGYLRTATNYMAELSLYMECPNLPCISVTCDVLRPYTGTDPAVYIQLPNSKWVNCAIAGRRIYNLAGAYGLQTNDSTGAMTVFDAGNEPVRITAAKDFTNVLPTGTDAQQAIVKVTLHLVPPTLMRQYQA